MTLPPLTPGKISTPPLLNQVPPFLLPGPGLTPTPSQRDPSMVARLREDCSLRLAEKYWDYFFPLPLLIRLKEVSSTGFSGTLLLPLALSL